jgi:hypothetical protein
MELLNESAQNAFFLGSLLYGIFFAGQALLERWAHAKRRNRAGSAPQPAAAFPALPVRAS